MEPFFIFRCFGSARRYHVAAYQEHRSDVWGPRAGIMLSHIRSIETLFGVHAQVQCFCETMFGVHAQV